LNVLYLPLIEGKRRGEALQGERGTKGVRLIVNIIDSYRFGLIVINGKRYSSDVTIR